MQSTEPLANDSSRIQAVFEKQKNLARVLRTSTLNERLGKLRKLRQAVLDNQDEMCKAAWADFKKTPAEVEFAEIFAVLSQVNHAIRHLRKWMKPERVATVKSMHGTRSHVHYEPKGTALIISPWNYPFTLSFGPLVSALAAGNTAIIKPSEMTPNMSELIRRIQWTFQA